MCNPVGVQPNRAPRAVPQVMATALPSRHHTIWSKPPKGAEMADDAFTDRKPDGSTATHEDSGDCAPNDTVDEEPESEVGVAERTPDDAATGSALGKTTTRRLSPVVQGALVGIAVLVTLGGLVGWLAHGAHQSQQAQEQRQLFLQAGRQGALNLTTIDYSRVDTDIQRVLDSATGAFHDDFQRESPAFAQVVKQAQSKSEGSITEAGIESVTGDTAQVLVSVSVKTSNVGAQEQEPRHWRMRVSVEKIGDGAKVSKVGFVP
jgi:Mce-associated membrane protein